MCTKKREVNSMAVQDSTKNLMVSFFEDMRKRLGLPTADEVKRYFKKQIQGHEGDFAFTLALRESKKNGITPNEAAENIKKNLAESPFIKEIKIVNGYVNCWFNYNFLVNELIKLVNEDYGKSDFGKKERVMIEHTSVNPNKALHIGHVRNSALGDSLFRLLKFVGYDVTVTNYIDDTGAQVADNIVGTKFLGFPESREGVKLDHYLGDEVYVKVNEMYKSEPSLMAKRSEVLKAIEHGNNEIAEYAKNMVSNVLIAQLQTLYRLKIHYNLINYESHILAYKFWDTAFKQLQGLGAIKFEKEGEKKGCWVFLLDAMKSSGDDKILVRSDGTVVYAGKDIAYAMWKHGLLKSDFRYKVFAKQEDGEKLWTTTLDAADENHPTFNAVKQSVNVIDIRQSYEQNVVSEAIKKLGEGKDLRYIHYGYEVVALSKNTAQKLGIKDIGNKEVFHMSGRKGVYINADDFLDKLHKLLYEETRNKNKTLNDKECHEIAEKLAVSTLRYEMVRTDPKNMIVFDIDRALKMEEKSAAYLNYTYARISSILKKVSTEDLSLKVSLIPELNEHEKNLISEILRFPEVVESAAKTLDLAIIANYVSDFALAFNSFYVKTPVLKAEKEQLPFRLWLVNSCKNVLENATILLGIIPVDRM